MPLLRLRERSAQANGQTAATPHARARAYITRASHTTAFNSCTRGSDLVREDEDEHGRVLDGFRHVGHSFHVLGELDALRVTEGGGGHAARIVRYRRIKQANGG